MVPQADDEVGRVGKTEIQLQGHGLAFFADGLEAQVEDDDRDGDDEDVEGAPGDTQADEDAERTDEVLITQGRATCATARRGGRPSWQRSR